MRVRCLKIQAVSGKFGKSGKLGQIAQIPERCFVQASKKLHANFQILRKCLTKSIKTTIMRLGNCKGISLPVCRNRFAWRPVPESDADRVRRRIAAESDRAGRPQYAQPVDLSVQCRYREEDPETAARCGAGVFPIVVPSEPASRTYRAG